jgi:hypothetical protein
MTIIRRRVILTAAVVVIAVGVTIGVIVANEAHGERVLCIGDSLMAQAGNAVTAALESKGYDVQVNAVPGSGLLDTRYDWPQTASGLVANFNPDIVVAEFIGDYGLLGTRPGVAPNSQTFFNAWRFAAQDLEDILAARHAQVYWVIGPPVAQPIGEHNLTILDQIYEMLIAPDTGSGHPPVVNMNSAFAAPGGGYTEYLRGPYGQAVQVRTPDGTHLTPAGESRFAQVVARTVKPVSPLRRIIGI